jgi:hypothetical protein
MHLKTLRKDVAGDQSGTAPDEVSVALDAGSIDFQAILQEATKAGVKRFYIEDESPLAPSRSQQAFVI